jgi:hypothetical protein
MLSGNRVTFEVAGYDKRRSLIIDPALAYSTYLGGSGSDVVDGIAVDASGNVYVTGFAGSTDFPTIVGAFQTTFGGGVADVFISKLNSAGSALVYSTFVGGSAFDQGTGIVIDASGNAYVVGGTFSNDFPTTPGAFQTTSRGGDKAFVSKLNRSGSALSYSTYLGGSTSDAGFGIALDASGNAYVTGFTFSNDFPTTPGAFQTTLRGIANVFVSKLNPTGSALSYSTYLGGTGKEEAYDIALDASGNAYVVGDTFSNDFPTTPGAFQTTYGGNQDAFVSKLNPTGSALSYSTYLGGSGFDLGVGIALDASGNAYLTGITGSSDFPTTSGAFQTTYGGGTDAFVSKLNSTGSSLRYSTYLGGSDYDTGRGIALDASGNAYVTGDTSSNGFPTTPGAFQTTYAGNGDAFVSKLNSSGSALVYSTYLGGSNGDEGFGIALDSSGNAYVTGDTYSSEFPITRGAVQTTLGGFSDAFVSKFSFAGIPFSRFGGNLLIDPDVGVFYLSGGFKLGAGGSINPSTAPVTFSVGSYSVTLPPGSFVKYKTGYVYQKTVNHIFLCVFIKFTSTPGSYALLANRIGGTLTSTTSPVPVTLAIGDDSGTAQMKAKFD